jgi:hypothetical protein
MPNPSFHLGNNQRSEVPEEKLSYQKDKGANPVMLYVYSSDCSISSAAAREAGGWGELRIELHELMQAYY